MNMAYEYELLYIANVYVVAIFRAYGSKGGGTAEVLNQGVRRVRVVGTSRRRVWGGSVLRFPCGTIVKRKIARLHDFPYGMIVERTIARLHEHTATRMLRS
jgi:hypothetical protein